MSDLPAETGTAVIRPRVMNRSYVTAQLKLPSKLAAVIQNIRCKNRTFCQFAPLAACDDTYQVIEHLPLVAQAMVNVPNAMSPRQ